MPYDSDMLSYLETLSALDIPDVTQVTLAQARTNRIGPYVPRPIRQDDWVQIRNELLSLNNTKMTLRIYQPKALKKNLPGIIFIHGGGFVMGSLDHYDPFCIDMVKQMDCVVISVDYRLAPEYPFPIPVQDCYAASKWIFSSAKQYHVDPQKLFIAGDSAGGCLSAAVTLLARDQNEPFLKGQILLYPVTDNYFNTASYLTYADSPLPRDAMIWFWKQYLSDEKDGEHYLASPLKTAHCQQLPPALVITAECDPLLDEGKAYADKLKLANTLYNYHCFAGMVHGFIFFDCVKSAKIATNELLKKIHEFIKSC